MQQYWFQCKKMKNSDIKKTGKSENLTFNEDNESIFYNMIQTVARLSNIGYTNELPAILSI